MEGSFIEYLSLSKDKLIDSTFSQFYCIELEDEQQGDTG